MSSFVIRYRSGREQRYNVGFWPWPTWKMLEALAEAMLDEKGGVSVEFHGPNGLHGFIRREHG